MILRNAIIQNAKFDIGITEFPKNSNIVKYNDWYYEGTIINAAWCATSVSYWYSFACDACKTSFYLQNIDSANGFAYVPTLYFKAVKNGWLTEDPLPGDIVIIDFDGDGKWDHTCLFVEWMGTRKEQFFTVEGNTSPDNNLDKKKQVNGGMVCDKIRNYNKAKVKFVNLIDNRKF